MTKIDNCDWITTICVLSKMMIKRMDWMIIFRMQQHNESYSRFTLAMDILPLSPLSHSTIREREPFRRNFSSLLIRSRRRVTYPTCTYPDWKKQSLHYHWGILFTYSPGFSPQNQEFDVHQIGDQTPFATSRLKKTRLLTYSESEVTRMQKIHWTVVLVMTWYAIFKVLDVD